MRIAEYIIFDTQYTIQIFPTEAKKQIFDQKFWPTKPQFQVENLGLVSNNININQNPLNKIRMCGIRQTVRVDA